MTAVTEAGRRLLAIVRASLEVGAPSDPLAELTLLHGLRHIRIRDAVIAELLGHHHVAEDLLLARPTTMAWMHTAPAPLVLERAQAFLTSLGRTAARCEPEIRDALHSITALLLWLDGRVVDARFELLHATPTYPLAAALSRSIALGHSPRATELSNLTPAPGDPDV